MNLLYPDRPSALLTTINFQQKLHWPRFKLNLWIQWNLSDRDFSTNPWTTLSTNKETNNKTKMLQQNATNVQQIATQGGGDRALMSVVQRLGNLFVLQTNFTDLSVKLDTVQFIFISLQWIFCIQTDLQLCWQQSIFNKNCIGPDSNWICSVPKQTWLLQWIDCCNALQGNPNTLDCWVWPKRWTPLEKRQKWSNDRNNCTLKCQQIIER